MSEAGFRKITEAESISLALAGQIEAFYNADTAPSVYELSDGSFFYARGDGSSWRTVSQMFSAICLVIGIIGLCVLGAAIDILWHPPEPEDEE